jgi:hypothetical protein
MPDKTNGKSGYITSDKIEVKPLHNYTFSAWSNVKNGGGKNAPAIRIVELDKEGKNLKTTNVILNYETSGWIQKNKTFQTDNSTYWTYIMANIWDGYGTFWIDDISLKSDTNSQNLIKNPSFEDIDVSGVPINWNFIKKDLYFGVENTDQIDDLIKEKKGVWLVTSHVWSSKTKNELKLMKEILSKKYTNQSKINFVRIELFYYRE